MPNKIIYDKEFPCPSCGKPVHIKLERIIIIPAEPAQTEMKETIEPGVQTTLP